MRRIPKTVWWFLSLNLALSASFYYLIRTHNSPNAQALMWWCPGIAALVASRITNRKFSDFGWDWGSGIYQLQAYLTLVLCCSAAYLVFSLAGLVGLFHPPFIEQIAKTYGGGNLPGPVLSSLYINAVFGRTGILIVGFVSAALGEEIGWRGLLVPELSQSATFRRTTLLSGIPWAIWRFPMIDVPYGTPTMIALQLAFSLPCFTIMMVGISFPINWLRLRSGSLWTAVFFNASYFLSVDLLRERILFPFAVDRGWTSWLVLECVASTLIGVVLVRIFWNSDPLGSRQHVDGRGAVRQSRRPLVAQFVVALLFLALSSCVVFRPATFTFGGLAEFLNPGSLETPLSALGPLLEALLATILIHIAGLGYLTYKRTRFAKFFLVVFSLAGLIEVAGLMIWR